MQNVKKVPFGGFVIIKNGTYEQYEAAKNSGSIVFAEVDNTSNNE